MVAAVLRDGRTLVGGAVGVVEGSGTSGLGEEAAVAVEGCGTSALGEEVASALGEQVAETSGIDEPSNFRRLQQELEAGGPGQRLFLTRDE